MNDAIKDLLNLDTWTETRGAGSVDAVVCPSCSAQYSPELLHGLDHYYCACGKPFLIRQAQTPLGKALLTEATTEYALRAKAPKNACDYELVEWPQGLPDDVERIVIRDLDEGGRSVTNDAEQVVKGLRSSAFLKPGRKLFYIDSMGNLDEIVWEVGPIRFRPGQGRAAP